eukprot:4277652-Amphidinium_carterae.1
MCEKLRGKQESAAIHRSPDVWEHLHHPQKRLELLKIWLERGLSQDAVQEQTNVDIVCCYTALDNPQIQGCLGLVRGSPLALLPNSRKLPESEWDPLVLAIPRDAIRKGCNTGLCVCRSTLRGFHRWLTIACASDVTLRDVEERRQTCPGVAHSDAPAPLPCSSSASLQCAESLDSTIQECS